MSRPRTGSALAAVAWAATVVVATVVGMSAVGAIGSGILGAGQEPLTPAQVDQALAAARTAPGPAPAAPAPTSAAPTPTPAPTAPASEVITSPGGTIVARCAGGTLEVVSASPAQGFRLDDEQEHGRVRFRSKEADVRVQLSCRDGRPVGAVDVHD